MNKFSLRSPAIFSAFPEVCAGVTVREGTALPAHDGNFGFKSFAPVVNAAEFALIRQEALLRRRELAELLSPTATSHFAHQVHGDSSIPAAKGDLSGSTEGDAIITDRADQLIGVFVADCAGVLLYEPKAQLAAAIHSGWRGTRAEIVPKTIGALQQKGADPRLIHAYISPTACPRHYEVGPEFRDFFAADFLPTVDGRLGFDNAAAITAQLQEAGVHHIEASRECTVEDLHWHSYRRDKTLSGRFAVFIGRKAT